ncbi:putative hydrolase of the HAD superfamily [Paenibacillus sp. UNCCL117]|uniref:HAD-IA family hydrolase n=1 Tax=unclassified Paenibacillus TaxID=185978 RepID=UPI000880818B|nr:MULTISPECIES: HAD-IA family hydrolase [unclassified Paenibacillus]SDE44213.1 putative hydrolase of the HAD superfamily [Paenibacillus sp. cl123]SFW46202.1 putative hydrolase of the HAD superfamily [Paenibacillus sp. UNCCL117]
MTAKPQLVLDLAGVLVSNISPALWLKFAEGTGISFQNIKEQFDGVRKELWTGSIREEEFWEWLSIRISQINMQQAREMLIQSLEPLPGLSRLVHWSHAADIHIVSNHCKEWLGPTLEKVEPYAKSITISNQVGLSKPDLRIFQHVEKQFEHSSRTIIYIDDQEKNLKPAAELGWTTLLADKDHRWIEQVEPMLNNKAAFISEIKETGA